MTKAQKIKPLLAHIDTLKPNRLESEYLTGISINNRDDAHRAIDELLNQGIQRVFMSLGADGIIYGSHEERLHRPALTTQVVNATGAGDSMMASIAYGTMKQLPPLEILDFANACASLTLMAEATINENLSASAVNELLRKQT